MIGSLADVDAVINDGIHVSYSLTTAAASHFPRSDHDRLRGRRRSGATSSALPQRSRCFIVLLP